MRSLMKYILCVLFLAVLAYSQPKSNDIKLKLAQSYERGRDYENAIKLYEEVYAKDSSDFTVYDALKRNYLITKRYPQAITLMTRMVRQTPNDLSLMSQLGTVYVRNGEEAKAFEMWDKAILIDSSNEVTYSIVASAMNEARLFEKAIATYKRGRVACKNPKLFITDLAYLYGNTLKYADATQEYLKLIVDNAGQLGFVQSRMTLLTKNTEGLQTTTQAVEETAKQNPDNLIFSQLLAWLYMEGKKYEKAFDVYKIIDQKTNAAGREIYNFADRAAHDKSYLVASQAYQDVIQKFPKFLFLPQAKFGYARMLEELTGTSDTLKLFGQVDPFQKQEKPVSESEPQFTGAITAYKRIVSEHPKTEIAARSLLRIANLLYERDFNLDEAQVTLDDLIKNYVQFIPLIAEGKYLLGDIYLSKGDIDKAEETYQSLNDLRPVNVELQDKKTLRLAEIMYFRGKWKEAQEQLGGMLSNMTSNTTNDAITLNIFIQENQEKNSAELGQFAKADLLKRQRKLSEALAIYLEVFNKDTTSEIGDETLMSIGDIQAQMHRFADAVATYDRMAYDFNESINLDRAMIKMGQVYELGLHDKAKAIDAYQQLLEKFPNSIYVSEARKKIRELRGDTI